MRCCLCQIPAQQNAPVPGAFPHPIIVVPVANIAKREAVCANTMPKAIADMTGVHVIRHPRDAYHNFPKFVTISTLDSEQLSLK